MGIAMAFQNALQRFSRHPLAVIGIIAEQHHMANATLAHLFQRRMQCIRALVENPGGFTRFRPAAHGDALTIDFDAGKPEIR